MRQNSPTISLTNQNKPGLFSNLVLWNNPRFFCKRVLDRVTQQAAVISLCIFGQQ